MQITCSNVNLTYIVCVCAYVQEKQYKNLQSLDVQKMTLEAEQRNIANTFADIVRQKEVL